MKAYFFIIVICPQIWIDPNDNFSRCPVVCCFLQVERCARLSAQLIECEEKSQWTMNHMEDIKMQLRQTQQGTPRPGGVHVCHILV